MLGEYYAIVVKVSEPTDRCFVAMRFGEESRPLYEAIQEAANRLHLHPSPATFEEPAVSAQDIFSGIQSARIVVAACNPEPSGSTADPSVIYKAGLSLALGKPTLLMTSSVGSLPAEIDREYAFEYDPDEVKTDDSRRREQFVRRLQWTMRERLEHSPNKLTDEGHSARVSLAQNRHRVFLEPTFWDNFRTILGFGKTIRRQFQAIDTAVLDTLLRSVSKIFESESIQRREIFSLIDACRPYTDYYDRIARPEVFDPLPLMLKEVDTAFECLVKDTDPYLRARIVNARGFWEEIKKLLDKNNKQSYPALHASIMESVEGDLFAALEKERNNVSQLYNSINLLWHTTKQIAIQADSLIVNLIEIMM